MRVGEVRVERTVPARLVLPANHVEVFDTTLRDGMQVEGVSASVADVLGDCGNDRFHLMRQRAAVGVAQH
ncbi:MAG: hypothetical protein EBX51_07810, partial [Acidimicrobiia bacterium]|nr:hypothetical protein [Acidimicrobiia bacterium]